MKTVLRRCLMAFLILPFINATCGDENSETTPTLKLNCADPSSIPATAYHCLTNSGGATAPHGFDSYGPLNDVRLQEIRNLRQQTWSYENVCIEYRMGGGGTARFKQPDGSFISKNIRWGILVNSKGEPEVTSNGMWLLTHEGIGDPQIEMITYNPKTLKPGEEWPFVVGCR